MKKMLCVLMLVFTSMFSMAQVQSYRSTQFALATINEYTHKYTWSNWESSDVLITINLNTDIISIFSPTTQIYRVCGSYNNGQVYTDASGGRNIKFYVLNNNNSRGEIRLRVETTGNMQIYVDFSDYAWVYNVYRIQ